MEIYLDRANQGLLRAFIQSFWLILLFQLGKRIA